ncbi:hypothetical protein JCM3775_003130, partial [Rhodotorula graminis]
MPSPGPSPPPVSTSLPSTSTTPTPTSRAPRPVARVPVELEPSQVAVRRAVSGPGASPLPSPFPSSSLSPSSHQAPVRPSPLYSHGVQQHPPSPINGGPSPSNRHLAPPSPATSLAHLDVPASPTTSTSSRPDDPVTSLGGRRTPFFMIAPHVEWTGRGLERHEELEGRSANRGAGSSGVGGPARRFGVGGENDRPGEEGEASGPRFDAEEGPSVAGRPGRRVEPAALARNVAEVNPLDQVNPLDLANLVTALTSRVDELESFVGDLSHRLHVLETTGPQLAAQGGPPTTFLPRHQPLAPRFAPPMPPSMPPFPSPFPHIFPDGSYRAEPHHHRVCPNGDELTPPASPQFHPRVHPALSRTSSLLSSSSSSAPLGRHAPRERVASFGPLHFSPLEAHSSSSAPQPVGLGPARQPPFHPGLASSASSSMGGWAG